MGIFDKIFGKKKLTDNINSELEDNNQSEKNDSKSVTSVQDQDIIYFPSLETIFNDLTIRHQEVFHPVLSIKKSLINSEWHEGYIHVIQFNADPYNNDTFKFFNSYCKDTTIAFNLRNDKYDFGTDIRYFDVTEDWQKYQIETKEKFDTSRNEYLSIGKLFNLKNIQIGGEPEWWQSDQTPIDPDGNPMTFVTEIETHPFCSDSCDKKIFVFYSHKHNLVVELYQIT